MDRTAAEERVNLIRGSMMILERLCSPTVALPCTDANFWRRQEDSMKTYSPMPMMPILVFEHDYWDGLVDTYHRRLCTTITHQPLALFQSKRSIGSKETAYGWRSRFFRFRSCC